MNVVPYREIYRQAFIDLNVTWIEEYFSMEQGDYDILNHPENSLKQGAMIYFTVEDGQALATCMVVPLENNVWEICKLAADKNHKQRGAGSAVLKACMDYAVAHGAEKLTLVSNHILRPALSLYKKAGFRQVPVERPGEFERVDVQFDYIVPGSGQAS